MRIISGQFRGRKLHSLKHNDLRPTTNKIREKLFNILEHNKQILKKDSLNDVELLLDICCGLGSIGFEALSRGVKKVTMIDKNPIFGDLVHLNASNLKVTERFEFRNHNATNLPEANIQADLCYIDPPYKFGIEQKILNQLSKKNWLKNNAIVIVESGKKIQLKIPNEFQLLDERIDGITKLLFLQYVKVI